MNVIKEEPVGPSGFDKRRKKAINSGIIVPKETVGAVCCHACMECVIPIPCSQTVLRHQDPSIQGFEITVNSNKCPFCDERNLRPNW